VAAPLINIANVLTMLRLALVPVLVVFLMMGGTTWRIVAFVVFGVASATDFLDGELARPGELMRELGTVADPIADKALMGQRASRCSATCRGVTATIWPARSARRCCASASGAA
jgi:phosphatidylglycerophosphate synthase